MLRRIIARGAEPVAQTTHGDAYSVNRAQQKMKAMAKREILAAVPLPKHPGHWMLTGRIEGEFGTWHVIRTPKGAYRTAVMPNCSEQEPMVVELGDKVTDSSAVMQFESGFTMLQQSLNASHGDSSPAA